MHVGSRHVGPPRLMYIRIEEKKEPDDEELKKKNRMDEDDEDEDDTKRKRKAPSVGSGQTGQGTTYYRY